MIKQPRVKKHSQRQDKTCGGRSSTEFGEGSSEVRLNILPTQRLRAPRSYVNSILRQTPDSQPSSVIPWAFVFYPDRRWCVGFETHLTKASSLQPYNFREQYAEHRRDTKVEVDRKIIWPKMIIERLQLVPRLFFMRAFSSVIRNPPCPYMPAWHRSDWLLIFKQRVEWASHFSHACVRMLLCDNGTAIKSWGDF